MDEEDRHGIQGHLLQTNDSFNQQIQINTFFCTAIDQFKEIIKRSS